MELNAANRLRASGPITKDSLRKLALEHKMNLTKGGFWEAKNDAQDDSITEFIDTLEKFGFNRSKAKDLGKNAFYYRNDDGLVVTYSANYGKGYQAILGIYEE